MGPVHSEAKQTKMLESGGEKGFSEGYARRTVGSCPPPPQTPQENKFHVNALLVTYSLFVNFLSFFHSPVTDCEKKGKDWSDI